MKKILFSMLALVVTSSLFAQKFEIGLNGGAAFNNMAAGEADPPFGIVSKGWMPVSPPSVSIKAMRVIRKWKYGVAVDYSSCAYTVTRRPGPIDYGAPL